MDDNCFKSIATGFLIFLMKTAFSRILFWLVFLVSIFSTEVYSAQNRTVAVLISREIAPYISAVNGLEETLINCQSQRFFLDKNKIPYSLSGSSATLKPEQYAALIAIGPDALRYLLEIQDPPPISFGMILNPQHLFEGHSYPACGVSLNLPVRAQFTVLLDHLPWLKRLGVLFDPDNNQLWYDDAAVTARQLGIELVPLEVRTDSGRINIVGDITQVDAISFIPDSSIISRVVIQYIIKQAFLSEIPVIGYNKFFLDSGATLSFIIDYEQVGRQLAGLVESQLMTGVSDGVIAPNFSVRINAETWQLLHLDQKRQRQ